MVDLTSLSSPLCDTERSLGYLLGLHLRHQASGPPVQACEVQLRPWLESVLLKGGGLLRALQPIDPYEEEKGEARSTGSSAATPGELLPTSLNYDNSAPELLGEVGLRGIASSRSTAQMQMLAEQRQNLWEN